LDVVDIEVRSSSSESRVVLPVTDSQDFVLYILVCIVQVAGKDLSCLTVGLAIGVVCVAGSKIGVADVHVEVASAG
jgi:hypothetical protein